MNGRGAFECHLLMISIIQRVGLFGMYKSLGVPKNDTAKIY